MTILDFPVIIVSEDPKNLTVETIVWYSAYLLDNPLVITDMFSTTIRMLIKEFLKKAKYLRDIEKDQGKLYLFPEMRKDREIYDYFIL